MSKEPKGRDQNGTHPRRGPASPEPAAGLEPEAAGDGRAKAAADMAAPGVAGAAAGEKAGREKAAGEKVAGEKVAGEKAVGEKAAGEKAADEKVAGREKAAGEKAAATGGAATEGADDGVDAGARDRDQYLRLAADFENFRRRSQQELLERSRYASVEAARELVPVLDNLRRAVDSVPADGPESTLHDGLTLVVREFEAALERLGVVAIEAVGSAFDPSIHEAIGGEESEEVDRDTVIDEVLRGYRLHDRVVRPSLVRIAHPKS